MITRLPGKIKTITPISWHAFVPWLLFIVVVWVAANTSFNKDYKNGVIEADAKGYYAYLPAVFIYHDLNFGFYNQIENKAYYNSNLVYEYRREINSKIINKYYAGTALCLAPFYVTGHLITLVTGWPADGYSYYYTLLVHIGAMFYFLLAIVGLRSLLKLYEFDDTSIAFTLITMVLGTNLFYYVITEFGMSHLYSLATIIWFCIYIRKYFLGFNPKFLVYSFLILGIITLIRPLNVLVVLSIPFLTGNKEQLFKGVQKIYAEKWYALLAICGFLLIVSLQFIMYKIATGNFVVYSYTNEGFNFLKPEITNFLFSYRKGMFVYTPVLLVCLGGFVYLYRDSWFQFYTLAGFLFFLVYVLSSWHMWFYGGSFSQRVMIEFYPFFAILLVATLSEMRKRKLKYIFLSLLTIFIIICQIQTYQYRRMQIHWSDMNKEKYWDVFLRIDKLNSNNH